MINTETPIISYPIKMSGAFSPAKSGVLKISSSIKDKLDTFQIDRIKTQTIKDLKRNYPARIFDFEQYRHQVVLDIGSGEGIWVDILNHYGAHAFGIDPLNSTSHDGINPIRRIIAPTDTLITGDGRTLSIRSNSIDTIFSNYSIFTFRCPVSKKDKNSSKALKHDSQSLSDRVPSIKEVERVLKPGGKLYATTVNINNIKLLLNEAGTDLLLITDSGPVKDPTDFDDLVAPGNNPPIDRTHWVEITKLEKSN